MGKLILKQVFIYKDTRLIYQRIYGKAFDVNLLPEIINSIKHDKRGNSIQNLGSYDFFKNRISYLYDIGNEIFFILITGLSTREKIINQELNRLKDHFLMLFKDLLQDESGWFA